MAGALQRPLLPGLSQTGTCNEDRYARMDGSCARREVKEEASVITNNACGFAPTEASPREVCKGFDQQFVFTLLKCLAQQCVN